MVGRPGKFTKSEAGQRQVSSEFRRLQAFIPADVHKRLKVIAAKREIPFSELIGEALREYVRRHRG